MTNRKDDADKPVVTALELYLNLLPEGWTGSPVEQREIKRQLARVDLECRGELPFEPKDPGELN